MSSSCVLHTVWFTCFTLHIRNSSGYSLSILNLNGNLQKIPQVIWMPSFVWFLIYSDFKLNFVYPKSTIQLHLCTVQQRISSDFVCLMFVQRACTNSRYRRTLSYLLCVMWWWEHRVPCMEFCILTKKEDTTAECNKHLLY